MTNWIAHSLCSLARKKCISHYLANKKQQCTLLKMMIINHCNNLPKDAVELLLLDIFQIKRGLCVRIHVHIPTERRTHSAEPYHITKLAESVMVKLQITLPAPACVVHNTAQDKSAALHHRYEFTSAWEQELRSCTLKDGGPKYTSRTRHLCAAPREVQATTADNSACGKGLSRMENCWHQNFGLRLATYQGKLEVPR